MLARFFSSLMAKTNSGMREYCSAANLLPGTLEAKTLPITAEFYSTCDYWLRIQKINDDLSVLYASASLREICHNIFPLRRQDAEHLGDNGPLFLYASAPLREICHNIFPQDAEHLGDNGLGLALRLRAFAGDKP